jgi:hypothetical protein
VIIREDILLQMHNAGAEQKESAGIQKKQVATKTQVSQCRKYSK